MKRILVILLVLSLLLAGCGKAPQMDAAEPSGVTDPSTPAHPSEPAVEDDSMAPSYTQQPMVAVSVPATTKYVTDDNGNVLFSHTRQNIHLTLQDPEVADKIIIDFLGRIEQTNVLADMIYKQAINDVPTEFPYTFQLLYSPVRIDQNVLSLYGTTLVYSGGIHPDRNCTAANYNMITGDVLTLGSIITGTSAIEALYQQIIQILEENRDFYCLLGGYKQVVHEILFSEESYNESWFFSPTGLCFYFPPYEIAPYSSGIIIVEVPYENLTGIIGDEFFPPEITPASGEVAVLRRVEADMSAFTQIAEVTIDDGGEMFLLYTDNTVYDVRLEVGSWDEDCTVFTPTYTAFAAKSLTPGDAVMGEAYFPDVVPILRLSYVSGTETVYFFIHQSGMDGSIYLSSQ